MEINSKLKVSGLYSSLFLTIFPLTFQEKLAVGGQKRAKVHIWVKHLPEKLIDFFTNEKHEKGHVSLLLKRMLSKIILSLNLTSLI